MRIFSLLTMCSGLLFLACQQEQKLKTANGYEYIKYTNIEGVTPQAGDYVYFHAQIRNGDSVLYTSREQGASPKIQIPINPNPNQPPSPVEDILRLMTVGDSATVYIPLDSVPQRQPGFENAESMIYDVVLLNIETQEQRNEKLKAVQARTNEIATATTELTKQYTDGGLTDQLQTTDSGLKYIIHEEGSGPTATAGRPVTVHYYGVLTDGTMFDNSFRRGEPITFPLGMGRVIKGWDEGLALLKKGAKATLFIPYELAYGEAGRPPSIPAKSELVFYVEMEDVK